tara:strand:+ start:2631 stop:2957 length:327 start_codon:yes stop_codon:yes gene_type:complete
MKKEYNVKLKNGRLFFESKSKGVATKMALLKILWESEAIPIHTIAQKINEEYRRFSTTPQRLSNLINGHKIFKVVGITRITTVQGGWYDAPTYSVNDNYVRFELNDDI